MSRAKLENLAWQAMVQSGEGAGAQYGWDNQKWITVVAGGDWRWVRLSDATDAELRAIVAEKFPELRIAA